MFLRLVRDSLAVRRHLELFEWLQGDLQRFLPHQVAIAAWGNFAVGVIHFDVVSSLPGLRTVQLEDREICPILSRLFNRWEHTARTPICVNPQDECLQDVTTSPDVARILAKSSSALVHGIKDERGQHDCLYVILGASPLQEPRCRDALQVLLPYLDTALRQVSHLPAQQPVERDDDAELTNDFGLSGRELEIMEWVMKGKTNQEIGMILDISAFTVKNHLQRIFKKLDVLNRAQAVAKLYK